MARFLDFSIVISILFWLVSCSSVILWFLMRSLGRVKRDCLDCVRRFILLVSFRRCMARKGHVLRNMNLFNIRFRKRFKRRKNRLFR